MKLIAPSLLIVILAALAPVQAQTPSGLPGAPQAIASKDTTAPSMKLDKSGAPDAGFLKAHEKFLAIAKENNSQVLFLGDSITQRWANPSASEIFEKNFGAYHPANFGISGDCTQHVLWRLANGELDGFTPKVIVLLIGTNNTASVEGEHIIKGVRKVVETIREKAPASKILLLSIFPRGEHPNPLRDKVIKANTGLARLDDGQNVFFLNIADKFLQPDGTISKEVMADFLHPTPKGYEIWAEAMKPKLDELMKQP